MGVGNSSHLKNENSLSMLRFLRLFLLLRCSMLPPAGTLWSCSRLLRWWNLPRCSVTISHTHKRKKVKHSQSMLSTNIHLSNCSPWVALWITVILKCSERPCSLWKTMQCDYERHIYGNDYKVSLSYKIHASGNIVMKSRMWDTCDI